MALNKKNRGSILIGSVGSVAIIFGFVAAGLYPSSLQPQGSVPSQEQETPSEVVPNNVKVTQTESEDVPIKQDLPVSDEFDWLSFPSQPGNVNSDDSILVQEADRSADLEINDGKQQQLILECSVPETIRRTSTPTFSAILFDSNLQPVTGQTIVWKIMSTEYVFSSVTGSDGTTDLVVSNLSDLDFGKYTVSATFDSGSQTASCTQELSMVQTYFGVGHGGGNSGSDDDSADVSAKPVLRITMPSAGDSFTGPSFGGIPVTVAGTTSEDGSIESVEVRWTPWYGGLTGYRTAEPNNSGDWSTWKYEGITFSTEGAKSILVKATDKDGNKSWKLVAFSVSFTEDNTKPQINIAAPAEGSVVSGATVTVTGTASDFYLGVQKVEVRTDLSEYEDATPSSDDWSEWSHEVTFASSGAHQIVARVTDNQGNMQWQIIDVTVELAGDEGGDL